MVDTPSNSNDSDGPTVEELELDAGGETVSGRLNTPADSTDRGVVCLHGGGHGPYGDVFDRVAKAAAERGHYFLRYDS